MAELRSLHAPARLIGWLVVALALGFVGHRLWQSAPWALAAARITELALAIGAGALGYALAGFLLAEAWRRLLGPGAAATQPRHQRALYGRTQIAKYLPGNCFHFVGRQLLGRRLGHAHGALALASFAEMVLLLAVAGALALPLVGLELAHTSTSLVWAAILAMPAGIAALVVVIACRHSKWRGGAVSRTLIAISPLASRLLYAALLHFTFFVASGLILWAVAAAIRTSGEGALDPATAVSALALAWWGGFVVPGAAAGVGVREAILVLTLEPHLAADGAVLVALALRVVTTLGDLLFFGLCMLMPAHDRTDTAAQSPQLNN